MAVAQRHRDLPCRHPRQEHQVRQACPHLALRQEPRRRPEHPLRQVRQDRQDREPRQDQQLRLLHHGLLPRQDRQRRLSLHRQRHQS